MKESIPSNNNVFGGLKKREKVYSTTLNFMPSTDRNIEL